MNTDSNPKRDPFCKFILQKETNKKQEKCFNIAMEIDIPTVHLRTTCESFSEAFEDLKCIKLKTMSI